MKRARTAQPPKQPPTSEPRLKVALADATMLRNAPDEPLTDHLDEIEDLAAGCIETAIELLPEYDECRTKQEETRLCNHLLIHLRAIQQELKMFREEQKA